MKLIAQAGPNVGREFPLAKAVITIGRVSDNDIVLPDPQVSRRHAEIRRQDDWLIITDLNSTNGTLVNGVHIQEPQTLQHGDQISIGDTAFLFQMIPEIEVPPVPAEQPPSPPTRRRGPLPVLLAAMGAVIFVSALTVFFASRGPKGETPTSTETPMATQPATVTPTSTSLPPTPTMTATLTTTSTYTPTPIPTPTLTPTLVLTLTPTLFPDAIADTTALNVRAGPGIAYDIIGGVYEGDELEVVAKTPTCDWLQVITPDGTEGWVSAHYVKLNINCDDVPAGSIPPTPTP